MDSYREEGAKPLGYISSGRSGQVTPPSSPPPPPLPIPAPPPPPSPAPSPPPSLRERGHQEEGKQAGNAGEEGAVLGLAPPLGQIPELWLCPPRPPAPLADDEDAMKQLCLCAATSSAVGRGRGLEPGTRVLTLPTARPSPPPDHGGLITQGPRPPTPRPGEDELGGGRGGGWMRLLGRQIGTLRTARNTG